MSLVSSVANYGGRQPDNIQNIKQFIVGVGSQVIWIFKRLSGGMVVQTPANRLKPVLIDNDLYVANHLYVDNHLYVANDINVTNDIHVNGSIWNFSDKNLKKNIQPITDDKSNSIINLEPVEFNYKDDKSQRKHLGFIAQDVEQIYPELVTCGENDIKSINYIEFIPLLVLKIQNQQKEIHELRQQLNQLNKIAIVK